MVKKNPNNITLGTGTFQKYIYSKLSVRFINFYLMEFELTSVAGFTLTLLLLYSAVTHSLRILLCGYLLDCVHCEVCNRQKSTTAT